MKLAEYNRWFVPIVGFGSALIIPFVFALRAAGAGWGSLPPGFEASALAWTVLGAGCVAVLTFGVPLPPAWRLAAALLMAAGAGICGVFALLSATLGQPALPVAFVLSGGGLAVIAVGMGGTVLRPEGG